MLMYMFLLNWIFSMIFLFLNHPLSLGCILLIQTILISLMSGFLYMNFWFSYILFLIMIGGMLVMFIYMTSIASNEKFNLPKKIIIFWMIFFMLLLMLIYLDNFLSFSQTKNLLNLEQSMLYKNFSLTKFFNYPNIQILILLMIYLLITLIAIVKIIDKKNSSLRQFI